jgi:hypothetical protein
MYLDLDLDRPVLMRVLGSGAPGTDTPVKVLSVSGRRMVLASDLQPEPGTPVRITCPQYVVLAEVDTRPEQDQIVLMIRHILQSEDLNDIRSRWIDEQRQE